MAVIQAVLRKIPNKINVNLFLDPDQESDWLEVLSDGTWVALGFAGDEGQDNYYSYNASFAGTEDLTPLLSGGQSPVEKYLALQDMETAGKAVEYFIRTGKLYPGIEWAHQES